MPARYRSVFDIIGPIMIGPSSSHVAGAVRIGRAARQFFHGAFTQVTVRYYESFAQTHRGHGTDYAIASGLLGFDPADRRVPIALDLIRRLGVQIEFIEMPESSPIQHPNTAQITLANEAREITLWGCSIGGGLIEVRKVVWHHQKITTQGPLPLLFVETEQEIGPELDQLFGAHYRLPRIVKQADHLRLYKLELDEKPVADDLQRAAQLADTSKIMLL